MGPAESILVEVSGARPAARSPGPTTVVDASLLEATPTRRTNSLAGFMTAAPGISPTSQSSTLFSAWGGGVDQNVWYFDGFNVSAISNGILRVEPALDMMEEVTIQSVGASAEYGSLQGAIINATMRQGGNHLSGNGSYFWQPSLLTSQPFRVPFDVANPDTMSGYERQHYNDATTTLGGPISRDRAWFFAGFQYLYDEESQPGGDPVYPKKNHQQKAFGKLTWQLAPGWRLMQSLHQERWDNRELPTSTKMVEATQRIRASASAITLGHLIRVSANRVWDLRVGRLAYSQETTRAQEDATGPGVLNLSTRLMTGAPAQTGEIEQRRWTVKTTFGQFTQGLIGSDHDWKVGAQVEGGDASGAARDPDWRPLRGQSRSAKTRQDGDAVQCGRSRRERVRICHRHVHSREPVDGHCRCPFRSQSRDQSRPARARRQRTRDWRPHFRRRPALYVAQCVAAPRPLL